jgi:hypothetical protein
MDRTFKVLFFAPVLITLLATVSPLRADVPDAYCYLEAGSVDVYVVVWKEDRQGNKGRQIWQGVVKQGSRVKISAPTGGIRYSSTVNIKSQNALSGDRSRWCENGATIGVP